MIAGTRRGLVVNSLWYLREVDSRQLVLTGTTRDGVYVVRDGEVIGAAGDFRFNESPLGVLARTTEVGRAVPALPREWHDRVALTAMPPLRVAGAGLTPTRV